MNHYHEVTSILTDKDYDRDTRLAQLQGFRGEEAVQSVGSGVGSRLAPGLCGVGAVLGVVLESPLLLGALTLTAVSGVFARNHVLESAYNVYARRWGTPEVPRNLAGRRMGCFISTFFLGGSAIAYTAGANVLGAILGLSLGCLALFVAATNICVPSIVFTLIRGSERTQLPALLPALFGRKN